MLGAKFGPLALYFLTLYSCRAHEQFGGEALCYRSFLRRNLVRDKAVAVRPQGVFAQAASRNLGGDLYALGTLGGLDRTLGARARPPLVPGVPYGRGIVYTG